MEPDDDKIIGYLEDQGAIIWDGQSDDGEAVFRFDLEKLKEVMPDLHAEIMADIDKDLMELYQMGMVEVEYDENLNAMFKITEEAEQIMRKLRDNPPPL